MDRCNLCLQVYVYGIGFHLIVLTPWENRKVANMESKEKLPAYFTEPVKISESMHMPPADHRNFCPLDSSVRPQRTGEGALLGAGRDGMW
jgi:hypothetical protein